MPRVITNRHLKTTTIIRLGCETLSTEQAEYAAGDVLYLHQIREKLDGMLMREARADIATRCFSFLPTQAKLDLTGFAGMDIFITNPLSLGTK